MGITGIEIELVEGSNRTHIIVYLALQWPTNKFPYDCEF